MEGEWKAEPRVMSTFPAGATEEKMPSRTMESGGRSSPGWSLSFVCSTLSKIRKYLQNFLTKKVLGRREKNS